MDSPQFNSVCIFCERKYKYSKKSGHTKKVCNACLVNNRRFTLKIKCLKYKGNKCFLCGYDKCKRALTFHHLDPTQKDFNISGSHSRCWIKIQKELDKCILLCMNCHMEEHEKLVKRSEESKQWNQQFPKEKKFCTECKNEISYNNKTNFCKNCYSVPKKIQWPSKEELEKLVWEIPTELIGKNLGVSGKAVEKYCKKLQISKPARGYWQKQKIKNAQVR